MFISRKRYNELIRLSFFDEATGFYNRNWFEKHYIQHLQRGTMSLAVIDINNLKATNDNHGHWKGDILIQQIGKKLSNYSTVVRWGGDEFFCIIKDKKMFAELCKNQDDFAYAYKFDFDCKDIKEVVVELDRQMYDCKRNQKITNKE